MSQHTIVVYEDAGQTRLGLLREQDSPKKGKIPIIDSLGNDKVIPSGRLVLTLPHKVSGPLQGMPEKLTALQEAAGAEESDLATIWELTFEEDAQFALEEMLELITDSPSNRELLSLYLSLTRDSVYVERKG
mgnify:CR=1 FL=1